MPSLTELWIRQGVVDPVRDIRERIAKESSHQRRKIIEGLEPTGIPGETTPLMLLMMQPQLHKEGIRELIIEGASMNQGNHHGLTPLHVILMSVFHSPVYLDHLEWWLSLGANPNVRYVDKKKKVVMHGWEYFNYLLSLDDWGDEEELDLLPAFPKRTLAEDEIRCVNYLFLCFDAEDCITYTNPFIQECKELNLIHILPDTLRLFPILEKKVAYFWNLHHPISDLYQRHRFLCQYRKKIDAHFHKKNFLYMNSHLEEDEHHPASCYLQIEENGTRFYFHVDMVPSILENGKNPFTNLLLSEETRRNLVEQLERVTCFRYKPRNENFVSFPRLFTLNERTSDIVAMTECVNHILLRVHPYSNARFLRNFSENQIRYSTRLFSQEPYNLEAFQGIITLRDYLLVMCGLLLDGNSSPHLDKIHFGIEECIQDYEFYNEIQSRHGNTDLSFFDILNHPELYEMLLEKASLQYRDVFYYWHKILDIYSIEHVLSEDTYPMLLENEADSDEGSY